MNGKNEQARREREKYVRAFNDTMVKIWKEQIVLLGVIDTGALYQSVAKVRLTKDEKFTNVTLSQKFNLYGLYVDLGHGSNTWRGNPGDLAANGRGITANNRTRRPWFSRKYYASVMNIRDFFADNLGKECAEVVSNALSPTLARRFAT